MTGADLAPYAPRRTPDAEFYWQGVAVGELRYQVCNVCEEIIFHARSLCPYCLAADVRIEISTGRGTIYSLSIVYHAVSPAFVDKVPYAVGIVSLDEGFHMFTELIGPVLDELKIGQRVNVRYRHGLAGVVLPVFELDDAA